MEQVPWLSHLVAVQLVDQDQVLTCNIPRVTCSRVRRRCTPARLYRSVARGWSGSCCSWNTECLVDVEYSEKKLNFRNVSYGKSVTYIDGSRAVVV